MTFEQTLGCLTRVHQVEAPDAAAPDVVDPHATASGAAASGATGDRSVWEASTFGFPGGTIFGGQLLGQTIMAVARQLPEMPIRSISVAFPRAVVDTGTLRYDVDALQLGSTYSTHRVEVRQPDRTGRVRTPFTATVLSHQPGEGPSHAIAMPVAAGDPDEARPLDHVMVPWELRVAGATDIEDRAAQPGELTLWTRAVGAPDDDATHQALMAYLSDLMLIGTALLPHDGWSQSDAHHTMRTAVLNHHLSFHRPFRLDDWLAVHHTSVAIAGGTSLGHGHVFTRAGELVASFHQEAMIRYPDGSKL